MKYRATYGFNVRRYITREIEAGSHEEAERIAKAEAWNDIDAECARFANDHLDGFGDTCDLDPYLMLDCDDTSEEVCAERLQEPMTDGERVYRALVLLREARELVKAANNHRTADRIRSAISSCEGARRIQIYRAAKVAA